MCIHQTSAETQIAVADDEDAVEGVEGDDRVLILLLLLPCTCRCFCFLFRQGFGMLLRFRLLAFWS